MNDTILKIAKGLGILLERIVTQVTSARWLLTVFAGLAFLTFAKSYTEGKPSLEPNTFALIIAGCFAAYHLKDRIAGVINGNGNGNNGNGVH